MNEDLNILKYKVLSFLQQQPGYERYSKEKLESFEDEGNNVGVLFGDNLQAGVSGFGKNIHDAYEDFLFNWKKFNGFADLENS